MTDDADIGACAALVARGDPPRFRAVMAAPVGLRTMLFPLYAFNLEVARAPWVTAEPMIAAMRLQWWRDALSEIEAGATLRRHEVVTPLAGVLDARACADLDGLILARHADMETEAPRDRAAVLSYVDRTAGTLLWTAARLAGATAEGPVRDAGRAQGVAGLLGAVPSLVAKGRHPLPHGDPAEHAKALAEGGLSALARARAGKVERAARPVLLVLPEAEAALRRYAAAPATVMDPPPDMPSLRTRLDLARRAVTNRF